MSKQKSQYEVQVHFPESEHELLELRKQIGRVYNMVLREYILNLEINDEEKDKLYHRLIKQLTKQKEDKV